MTRRRRGAKGGGSVYYDQNAGRWVASVTVINPDTGKRSRRKMTAPDQPTARQHLKRMLAERDETGSVSRRDYTVGSALDDFLAHPPASWKTPTTHRINTQLADRLRAGLGSVLLSRLTAGQVAEHLRREVSGPRPLARRTIRDERALLRRAIRRAQQHDLASRNVAELADLPGDTTERKPGSLTTEQVSALLGSDLSPWWRAWLSISVMAGLRPGETGALTWHDVSLTDGVLHVRHSLHETPSGLAPGRLKTESSRRTIRLPQAVTDALTAWWAEQAAQQQAAGPAWRNDADLIFTDGLGRPVNRQKLHRGFRAACKAAGVTRPGGSPFQIRELRHTFVSVLSHGGVDIEVIADLAGHANSSITREVYRHQLAGEIGDAARVWDQIGGAR
jgi:integrase